MRKIDNFLFVATILCLSSGCGSRSVESPASAVSRQTLTTTAPTATSSVSPVQVEVFDVKPSAVPNELLIPAVTSTEETAIVLAGRDGTIVDVRAQEGARVEKGALLARFGNDTQEQQLRQAELDVNRLKIEERQYEALIAVNRNELAREKALAKDGISSRSDVERAEYKLLAANNEYEKTRIATQTAQSRLKVARIETDKSQVSAPVDGIVTRRFATLGTGVTKNDRLFEIARTNSLQVRFQLPQTERQLSGGSIVALSSVADNTIIAQARVRRAEAITGAAGGTLEYLADVIGGSRLTPGTAVNVRVPRLSVASTIWLPRAAFRAESELRVGASATLLIVEESRCAERLVGVNAIKGDQVEIISGLISGDRVIIAAPPTMKAGDPIEIR